MEESSSIEIATTRIELVWGFKPLEAGKFEGVRKSVVSRVVVIAIGLAVLCLVLGGVTLLTFQAQSVEQHAQTEIRQQFDEADLEGVDLVRVTVDYEGTDILLGNEPQVDVVIGIDRDREAPPALAQRIDDQLTEELERDVVVRVGFFEEQVSEGEPPDPPPG